MSKPLVIITVEGGVIQSVCSDVPVDYMVIDFDIQGADRNLCEVPQHDGSRATATVSDCESNVRGDLHGLAEVLRRQLKQNS